MPEMYTKVMELHYCTKATYKRAACDEHTQEWTVVIDRDG